LTDLVKPEESSKQQPLDKLIMQDMKKSVNERETGLHFSTTELNQTQKNHLTDS